MQQQQHQHHHRMTAPHHHHPIGAADAPAHFRIVVDDPRDVDAVHALLDISAGQGGTGPLSMIDGVDAATFMRTASQDGKSSPASSGLPQSMSTMSLHRNSGAGSAGAGSSDVMRTMRPLDRLAIASMRPSPIELSTLRNGGTGDGPATQHLQLVTLVRRAAFSV